MRENRNAGEGGLGSSKTRPEARPKREEETDAATDNGDEAYEDP
jgi:hypothetical protein